MSFEKVPDSVCTKNYNELKDILCMASLLKRFRNVSDFFYDNSFTSWFFFHKIEILRLVNF